MTIASAPTAAGSRQVAIEHHDDRVATLTLQRPSEGNALTPELLGELAAALDELAASPARAVVLTGAGRAFSLGGDLGVIRSALARPQDAQAQVDHALSRLAGVVLALRALPQPVVAAINGQAAGAGLALALACDVRIASARAALNFAYGALGTSPDGGMTWFLPRLVPPGRATQLLIEQPILRAPQALEEGLVSEVAPAAELLDRARRYAARLATVAPHAVRTARELVAGAADGSLPAQLERERDAFARAVATEDFREGVDAVLEGRRPVFHGR